MARRLSHLDSRGNARMVDVGDKPVTARRATAEGFVRMGAPTLRAIADGNLPKGDVLATARLAGMMAAKKTGELIPLCHPLAIEGIEVEFDLPRAARGARTVNVHIRATAKITAKTGVEMEALTAVAVAALTVYDMCKAIDKSMSIHGVRLIEKTGGTKQRR